MTIKVCVAGAVSRTCKGKTIQDVLGLKGCDQKIFGSVTHESLSGSDVMVDYTKPEVAKQHILTALDSGLHTFTGLRRGLDQVMGLDEK